VKQCTPVRAHIALAQNRLVENAEHRAAVLLQRDERAPFVPAGDEGARAVHRIEHPAQAARARFFAIFLAEDSVGRPLAFDDRADRGFGTLVGLGHGIEDGPAVDDRPLVGHIDADAEIGPDHRARRIGKPVREGDGVVVDGGHAQILFRDYMAWGEAAEGAWHEKRGGHGCVDGNRLGLRQGSDRQRVPRVRQRPQTRRCRPAVARVRANFVPLLFDVTDQAAVAAGAEAAAKQLDGEPLFGLVNNAGIAVSGPLLYLDIDDFRMQLEVNLTGQLIVTQAFAPLLTEHATKTNRPGRIVMISSVGGKNASPFVGPYNTSKFGLEGFSESLRREVQLLGIDVIVIAPGAVATPI
jgi:NAD(P)-dependent dehydrogenase (short-subunit alcohol dehydrogenase family)